MIVRLHLKDGSVKFVDDALSVHVVEEDKSVLRIEYVDNFVRTFGATDNSIDHVSIGEHDVFVPYGNEWKHSKSTSKQLNG